jgi:hypothetical protein
MKTKLTKKLPAGNSKKHAERSSNGTSEAVLISELKAFRSTRAKITWQIRKIKKELKSK